jgi:hypothetical protein
MRRRYRVLMFASLAAALVVPVGYALSVESMPFASPRRYVAVVSAPPEYAGVPMAYADVPMAAATVAAPMTIHVGGAATTAATTASDAVKLFGIGTLLFGLAAVVRKAI